MSGARDPLHGYGPGYPRVTMRDGTRSRRYSDAFREPQANGTKRAWEPPPNPSITNRSSKRVSCSRDACPGVEPGTAHVPSHGGFSCQVLG